MVALQGKAKQFLVFIAKLLVVGGAFYFIYDRIANDDSLQWQRITDAVAQKNSGWLIFVILLLTILNRFFEILKWQNLVQSFRQLSFAGAAEQVLAAVTAGIFTPNGIGEYAAKALYYKKDQAKQIVFLNLICNGIQMVIAIVAGLAGLLVFNALYSVIPTGLLLIIIGGIAVLVAAVFASRKITIKGYSLQLLFEKINEIPKTIHRKNILLATGRYLSIIHQHYFIFLAFGVNLPYPVMISAIAGVYFLGSSLPNFQFLDFAVRGSVAVFFFGRLGVTEWIVIFAATLQWLLNIVLPVSIGSYYVFRFKSERATDTTLHQE
ncbi:hypothetical protein FMM05_19940 [Flavobacterium zepuense]|uniref:Lysylphosphatidylglycerol synthase TM region n=1 Tax=Flavobacterium zepuense TaxID=2593302 RepID=A0A552UTR2_9FLAO|nr:lysylphosphatidylglycerol synthase domain-containing protein [Flavobacterium zepuense]TRW21530.1 hypothetical protein FMM05_19940 [Flavobacterium zepuense]